MKKLCLVVFLFGVSTSANAVKLFIEGGVHFGGDKLATALFTSGDTDDINAGELITLSAGIIAFQSEGFEVRSSFGIKFDAITADNGDITFTRFPLELMAFTKGESFNMGAGVSYHIGPEYEASGSFTGSNTFIDYEDALGFVAEIDYKLGDRGYLGLKATFIDYEAKLPFAGEVDGDSIGIVIGTSFK